MFLIKMLENEAQKSTGWSGSISPIELLQHPIESMYITVELYITAVEIFAKKSPVAFDCN